MKVHIIYARPINVPNGNVMNQPMVNFGLSKRRLVAVVIIFAHTNQKLTEARV